MGVQSGSGAQPVRAAPEDLESLMVGYQQADQRASTLLVEAVSPMLLRFFSGPLQTRALAEDMLQECWLRIHRSRHSYRPGSPALPWIFAIARYTRIDAYRRRRRIDSNETPVEDISSAPAAPVTPASEQDDLWRLVETLPPSQRDVIRMLKITGMSLEEVARATGSTVGAIKQKAHRAYEKLRVLLREQAAQGAKS